MKRTIIHLSSAALIIALSLMVSCNKNSINPNIPNVSIHITINPNSTQFLEINTVSGWLYLEEKPGVYVPPGSRGIIVYRADIDKFKAYERQPPNEPFLCCNADMTVCGKLVVGDYFPTVKDTCNDNSYFIFDGTLYEGEGQYSLIEYAAEYDGALLHIHN